MGWPWGLLRLWSSGRLVVWSSAHRLRCSCGLAAARRQLLCRCCRKLNRIQHWILLPFTLHLVCRWLRCACWPFWVRMSWWSARLGGRPSRAVAFASSHWVSCCRECACAANVAAERYCKQLCVLLFGRLPQLSAPRPLSATDGGGMKGMATVRLLRELERHTGKRIWELFDLIGKDIYRLKRRAAVAGSCSSHPDWAYHPARNCSGHQHRRPAGSGAGPAQVGHGRLRPHLQGAGRGCCSAWQDVPPHPLLRMIG